MNNSIKPVPLAVVREANGTYSIYDSGVQMGEQLGAEEVVVTLAKYLDAAYCEVEPTIVEAPTYHTHYYAWSLNEQKWFRFRFKAIQIRSLSYTDQDRTSFFEGAGFKTWAALRIIEAWNRSGNAHGFKYKLNDN